jgi:polygalacturonase
MVFCAALLVVLAGIGIFGYSIASNDAGIPASSGFSNYSCSAAGAAVTQQVFQIGKSFARPGLDSTRVIQQAIDSASDDGGGRVELPSGTFTVNGHIVMKTNVELSGVGPATVIKAGPKFLGSQGPDGGYPVITTSGASNVTVANLTADQSGDVLNGNSKPSERFRAYLIDVRNSHNAVVSGVFTRNPFTYSIAVVGSSDFCVTHCNTRVATSGRYDGLDGVHILDSNTGQVIGNYIDQRIGMDGDDGLVAHTINAPVFDVLYAENTVRGGAGGDGMQLAVGDYPVFDITIRDNDFWGSPFGIRTGYWNPGPNGSVTGVTISGNYIHDLVPGKAFPKGGNAIDIGGFGATAPVTNITVTGNTVCHAGIIIVVPGKGNIVTQNRTC